MPSKAPFGFVLATILWGAPACSGTAIHRSGTSDQTTDASTDAPSQCVPVAGAQKGIAKGGSYASWMITDEQSAYYLDTTRAALVKAPLGGGSPTAITPVDPGGGGVNPA